MLTEEMKSIIRTYPVGFVASVNADGTPNLSPKGTFVVLNNTQLAFGHIRSPGHHWQYRPAPHDRSEFP